MSQEDKLTIREYYRKPVTGRIHFPSTAISRVCQKYEAEMGKGLRRVYVSQVFHFKKSSDIVWGFIRSVFMEDKKGSIEFRLYAQS